MSSEPPAAAPRPFPRFLLVPFTPFLLIGIGAFGYGCVQAVRDWTFMRRAAHTSGTLVDAHKYSKGDYPVIRFTASNGQVVQFVSRVSRSRHSYRIPQPEPVMYDPQDPERAEIDSRDPLYSSIATVVFGAVGIGIGLGGPLVVYLIMRALAS